MDKANYKKTNSLAVPRIVQGHNHIVIVIVRIQVLHSGIDNHEGLLRTIGINVDVVRLHYVDDMKNIVFEV